MMDESAKQGLTTEELEAKRKARMERFGAEAVEESEKSIKTGKGGFRKRDKKFKQKQNQQKGNDNGFKGGNKGGKKRFKGN